MKVTIKVDCTPEEARRFLGLPDVSAFNDQMVEEMRTKLADNLSMLSADELTKSWMAFGQGAQDQFRKLMEAGLKGAKTGG